MDELDEITRDNKVGNNNYLIPANSKKSMLILGLFNTTDLVIFATGIIVSFVLMLSIQTNDIKTALLILTPALVCTFLIVPLPNQHNVRTFIKNVYTRAGVNIKSAVFMSLV